MSEISDKELRVLRFAIMRATRAFNEGAWIELKNANASLQPLIDAMMSRLMGRNKESRNPPATFTPQECAIMQIMLNYQRLNKTYHDAISDLRDCRVDPDAIKKVVNYLEGK